MASADNVSSMKRAARREASNGEYNLWGGSAARKPSGGDTELGRRHSGPPTGITDVQPEIEHVHHAASMPVPSPTPYNTSTDPTHSNGVQRRVTTNDHDPEKVISEDPESSQTTPARTNGVIAEEAEDGTASSHQGKATRKARWKKLILDDPVPWQQQLRSTLFPRWLTINWLLLFAPIGIGLHFAKVNALAIFLVNFVAIVPLAAILSFATEEIALRVGEVLGGLLNASFGYVSCSSQL
jgi:Ca2+:H+ antiporter